MIKRILLTALACVTLTLTGGGAVLAAEFGVGPTSVEFDVCSGDCAEVSFYISSSTNVELGVSLENIPLRVEPETISVEKGAVNKEVVLTFYGDKSLGNAQYEGKVRFMVLTSGNVTTGIKVKAKVNHTLEEQAETYALPGSSQTAESEDKGFPILPVAGSVLFASIIIAIIVIAKKGT